MKFDVHELSELCDLADFGLYIHVPFCERRCRYCAFVSSVLRPVPSELYVASLLREFEARIEKFQNRRLTTVYLGGGTPSMLADREIAWLLDHVIARTNMPLEMTFESNPEHVTLERAKFWKSLGFSRISLGIQSFDEAMLKTFGRRHSAADARRACDMLHEAGFDEISIDLIYGARCDVDWDTPYDPAREFRRWLSELEIAKQCQLAHVSCYELTLEPNTPLMTAQNHGHNIKCDEETILEMMHVTAEVLGMTQYEISNYARDHYFSRHNVSCWAGVPYLGLGVGAHSLTINDTISRQSNGLNVRQWLEAACQNSILDPEFVEILSPKTHLAERLLCAARSTFPWSAQTIARQLKTPLTPFVPCLEKALNQGLLEGDISGILKTTAKGIDLNNCLDEILFEFS